jgi:ferrochelatase
MGETSGPTALRVTFEQPGGAYAAQHVASSKIVVSAVAKDLGVESVSWQLVYQSRSGSPSVPWLEPDINDAIDLAHSRRKKGVIVVPIGFVSDHVEVIWDLDNEAKETASELGMAFARVSTPGTEDIFVDAIADLILERIENTEKKALSSLGPWPGTCAVGCCPNLRKELPVIAESA